MTNTWPGWKNVKLLGKGSFGSVYEIEKEEFGFTNKAALKVISIPSDESELNSVRLLDYDEQTVYEYFYDNVKNVVEEFRLMSSLKGISNIVSIEDFDVVEKENEFGWDILIRMELLTSLDKYQKNHPMSIEQILQMGIDICSALEICNSKNIIHRDIKPANIFVNDMGIFKLGDFGIARTVNKTNATMSHKGTYNYMAPEIYLGKKYNYNVDIYSLGIVLYRLLNQNKLPFYPDRLTVNSVEEALTKRMTGDKIPEIKGIDQKLSNIILKAIEFNPEKRYQNATEFKKALIRYLNNIRIKENEEDFDPADNESPTVYGPPPEDKTTILVDNEDTNVIESITETTLDEKMVDIKPKSKDLKKEIQKQVGPSNKGKLNLIKIIVALALVIGGVFGYKAFAKNNNSTNTEKTNSSNLDNSLNNDEDETIVENIYKIGDTITFGTYNGQKIEWIVLDEKDGKKLIASKYLLDEKPYNIDYVDITWEDCTLRDWLNNEFYNSAFTSEEQSKIELTKVENKDNRRYQTDGGNSTEDKVFLLSIEEVEKYFKTEEERVCAYKDGDVERYRWYWLRSPSLVASHAAYVSIDGHVYEYGDDVICRHGIRPVLWVNL